MNVLGLEQYCITVQERAPIRLRHLLLVFVGALALTWRLGFVFFDEVAQTAGLTSLAAGHLWVGDLPYPYNHDL